MKDKILITGGSGFIGSHTADALIQIGYQVRVLDNLDPQVHGPTRQIPTYLNPEVEFVQGDIRDRGTLKKVLKDIKIVYHLAALNGVTQSMYSIQNYMDVNVTGTAALWDVIVNNKLDLKKVILASSRAVCGEGAYFCSYCKRNIYPPPRSEEQLKSGDWEMKCPKCGKRIDPIPTREEKSLQPLSIYAQSKRYQEEICLSLGKTYGIPIIILRYFNVYGPRQSLSNPYTGIVPLICARILAKQPVPIYEDGQQIRDFVHVEDIVKANLLALDNHSTNGQVFNVGSGKKTTILKMAKDICASIGVDVKPLMTGQYRTGDVRSCFADISAARHALGFRPDILFHDGIPNLIDWVIGQKFFLDLYGDSVREYKKRGLLKQGI